MKIKIKKPKIYLKTSPESKDLLIFDLGSIDITNEFAKDYHRL